MKYTKEDLKTIIQECKDGETIEDVINRLETSSQVVKISEVVMSYFDVTNLVADTRRPEDIVPSVVFFWLCADLCFKPRSIKVYKTVCRLTQRDRTSYLYYIRTVDSKTHTYDNRFVLGDAVYNHFLNVKHLITGEDQSANYIKPYIKEVMKSKYPTKFQQVMDNKEEEILERIKDGCTSSYLNDNYFFYCNSYQLRKHFKRAYPALFYEIQWGFPTKLQKVFDEKKIEIIAYINRGYTAKEVNERYIGYENHNTVEKLMKKFYPYLYEKLIENKKKKYYSGIGGNDSYN
jgi:hypothetical protein